MVNPANKPLKWDDDKPKEPIKWDVEPPPYIIITWGEAQLIRRAAGDDWNPPDADIK